MFLEKLLQRIEKNNSRLCVGLDPDLSRLPEPIEKSPAGVGQFLQAIIEATGDLACVYKPNFAFFGALGLEGFAVLERTIRTAQEHAPVILDAKVGDIGNTAKAYAEMAFDRFGADAVTLNPYMGSDSIAPFIEREDGFGFILGITSNAGAKDIETLELAQGGSVYEQLAETFEAKFPQDNWGWVAGATQIEDLKKLRAKSPERWLLIPGVGAQGGAAAESLEGAKTPTGEVRGILNASRSILYASSGGDFKEAARKAALELVAEMR